MTDIYTAARTLLDAFGGDVPDWLKSEAAALEAAIAIKPQVVINISGGLLQGATANMPLSVTTLDFDDIPNDDPSCIIMIDGEKAYVGGEGAQVDAAWVEMVGDAPTLADEVAN